MDKTDEGQPVDYMGDGVYAIWHGYGIELRANDHRNPTDTIFLEDTVLEALNRFAKTCKKGDT